MQTSLRAVGGTQAVIGAQKLALLWEESVSNCLATFSIIWKDLTTWFRRNLEPSSISVNASNDAGHKEELDCSVNLCNCVVTTQDETWQPQCPHITKTPVTKPAMHFWK